MIQLTNTNNINILTDEILMLKQQTVQNIIEIGKRLIIVKESLPHGEFGNYLNKKVDFTERTAQKFMKFAKEFSNTKAISDLGQTKAFALLDIKSKKREKFITEKHEVDGVKKSVYEMSTRELQKSIKEHNDLEQKLKNNEQNIKKIKEKILLNTEVNNMSVRFEEVIKTNNDDDFLYYNIYFIKDDVEQLVYKEYIAYGFKYFDITNSNNSIVYTLEKCNTILHCERDFILAECLKFKEIGIKREKEINDEQSERQSKKFKDDLNGAFNEFEKLFETSQKYKISKEIFKKFYKTLALTYHPDKGGTNEEMIALNQLKQQWEI